MISLRRSSSVEQPPRFAGRPATVSLTLGQASVVSAASQSVPLLLPPCLDPHDHLSGMFRLAHSTARLTPGGSAALFGATYGSDAKLVRAPCCSTREGGSDCLWRWHGDHAMCARHGTYHLCGHGCGEKGDLNATDHDMDRVFCRRTGRSLGYREGTTWGDQQRTLQRRQTTQKRKFSHGMLSEWRDSDERLAKAAKGPRGERQRMAVPLVAMRLTESRGAERARSCIHEELCRLMDYGCGLKPGDLTPAQMRVTERMILSVWEMAVATAKTHARKLLNQLKLPSCVLWCMHMLSQGDADSSIPTDGHGRELLMRLSWFDTHPFNTRRSDEQYQATCRTLRDTLKLMLHLISRTDTATFEHHHQTLQSIASEYTAQLRSEAP